MEKTQDFSDVIADAKAKYEAGSTLKELARNYCTTQPTLAKALKKAGVEIRRPGRRKKDKQPLFQVAKV